MVSTQAFAEQVLSNFQYSEDTWGYESDGLDMWLEPKTSEITSHSLVNVSPDLEKYIVPGSSSKSEIKPDSIVQLTAMNKIGTSPGGSTGRIGVARATAAVSLDLTSLLDSFHTTSASFYIQVDVQTRYQMTVVPKPNETIPANVYNVPIIATTSGTISTSGDDSYAGATVSYGYSYDDSDDYIYYQRALSDQFPSFEGIIYDKYVPIGVPRFVKLDAFGSLGLYVGWGTGLHDSGKFSAEADPIFEIDPTFPYADDFQIIYSPGGDAPAAPEASTWAMLVAGFGALGLAGWKRSRLTARPR
jgi:hypothetical protein